MTPVYPIGIRLILTLKSILMSEDEDDTSSQVFEAMVVEPDPKLAGFPFGRDLLSVQERGKPWFAVKIDAWLSGKDYHQGSSPECEALVGSFNIGDEIHLQYHGNAEDLWFWDAGDFILDVEVTTDETRDGPQDAQRTSTEIFLSQVDDLAMSWLGRLLPDVLPEGGTTVDRVIRTKTGAIVNFSGTDESGDSPRMYDGRAEYFRDGRSTVVEWAYLPLE